MKDVMGIDSSLAILNPAYCRGDCRAMFRRPCVFLT